MLDQSSEEALVDSSSSKQSCRRSLSIRSEPTDSTDVCDRPLRVLWTEPMARAEPSDSAPRGSSV
jgi:hypothetical protein